MSALARRGSLLILVAALLWSTGGLFIKSVTLDAWGVSFWRSLFAVITLYLVYQTQRGRIAHHARESWVSSFTLTASLFYSALLILFVMATKLTTSANAIFLQFTAPIYVLLFEPIIMKARIKREDVVTVLIAVGAMALFFIGKFDTRSTWGNIAALASGVCFAVYAVMLKHEHSSEATRWRAVIIGHLVIVVAALAVATTTGTQMMPATASEFWMLAFLGIVQIGIAYSLFTFAFSHVRALDALLLSMLEPVLNPLWVYLGIGETPGVYALIGGGIILLLVAFRAFRGTKADRTLEPS